MIDLVYDTETTGLLDYENLKNAERQPRPVQLGMLLFQDRVLKGQIEMIITSDQPSHPEALSKHGISEWEVDHLGVDPRMAVDMFVALIARADRLVAHNSSFDWAIMESASIRAYGNGGLEFSGQKVCTMRSATPVLKIPKAEGGWKKPTLDQATRALVDPGGAQGAHKAMADCWHCVRLLWALEDMGAELVGP